MSTVEQTDLREVDARVVMDPKRDIDEEMFGDWREEINALLEPEQVRLPVRTELGRWEHQTFWILPEHELRLDVISSFVPTDLKGILWQGGQPLHWNAVLDLDSSHEVPGASRRFIYVFNVVQED